MKFGLFFEWPNPEFREFKDIFSEGSLKLAADEDILPLTSSTMGMEAISQQFVSYVRYWRGAGKPVDDVGRDRT